MPLTFGSELTSNGNRFLERNEKGDPGRGRRLRHTHIRARAAAPPRLRTAPASTRAPPNPRASPFTAAGFERLPPSLYTSPFGLGRLPSAARSRTRPCRAHLPRQYRALPGGRTAARPGRAAAPEPAALLDPHRNPCTPAMAGGTAAGGASPRPATCPPGPAPTHSACVKALSPGGTAASPRPEQSTPRSPSQLHGAGQGEGDAPPLCPAQLPRPQATRPSRARHRIADPAGRPAPPARLGLRLCAGALRLPSPAGRRENV